MLIVKMPCSLGQIRYKTGNLPCHFGDNILHSRQTLPANPPTASTFDFAPNHTNQPQGQSQKSLPADTSEKEILKNAPPHDKNKIHHSGQTLHDRQKRRAATNSTLPNIAGTQRK